MEQAFPSRSLYAYDRYMATTYAELIGRIEKGRARVEQPVATHLDFVLGVAREVAGGRTHAHANPVTMSLLGKLEPFMHLTRPSATKAVGLLAIALANDINGSQSHAQYLRDDCDMVLLGLNL